MDFKALIDFNKYTLALAAGGFAYTLEKYSPAKSSSGLIWLILALTLFIASALLGIFVFGAATSALHADDAGKARLERFTKWAGTVHATLLVLGMVILGAMTFSRVLTIEPETKPKCCCRNSQFVDPAKPAFLMLLSHRPRWK